MDPGTAMIGSAVIGGGMDILGGILGGNSAADEARKQRQWSARQYAKRYQVTVEDLKKAGLNPMLAYMGHGGVGAGSVPSGAAAPGMKFEGIGSRMAERLLQAQAIKSQVALNSASATKAASEGEKAAAEAEFIRGAQTTESSARSAHLGVSMRELETRISEMQWHIDRGMALLPTDIEKLNAEIANLKAGTVPKQLVGELGNLAMDVLRKLREPETPGKAKELLRDTLNLIDDVNKKTWVPHMWQQWKQKRREDYRTRGGRLMD